MILHKTALILLACAPLFAHPREVCIGGETVVLILSNADYRRGLAEGQFTAGKCPPKPEPPPPPPKTPHRACWEGRLFLFDTDSQFNVWLEENGLPRSVEVSLETKSCPQPQPPPAPPPPEPPPPPAPPAPPSPPPPPAPLGQSSIKPGPTICKAFGDVRGADVLVFTNVTDRPNDCNVWKYNSDGSLFETSTLSLRPREKRLVGAGLGFFGWWQVTCTEPWKGARQQPNLDLPMGGAMEREATPCLE